MVFVLLGLPAYADECIECAEIEKAWGRLLDKNPGLTKMYFDPRVGDYGASFEKPVFQGPVAPASPVVGDKELATVKSNLVTEIKKAQLVLSEAAVAVGRIPPYLRSNVEAEKIRPMFFAKLGVHSTNIDIVMKTVVPIQAAQISSLSFFVSFHSVDSHPSGTISLD